jgi:periplasmic protein TonB
MYEVTEVAQEYDEVPDQADLTNKNIGLVTTEGDPTDVIPIITEPENGPIENIVTINNDEDEKGFTKVEIEAKYPGGTSELAKFLSKNLQYPRSASMAGIEGKVYLLFTVSATGKISDISISKGIGFGCDEEALRVVGLMPKWTPGMQQGTAVKSKFTLPITFQMAE